MKNAFGRLRCALCASVVVFQVLSSTSSAVDTMADWVGRNNAPGATYHFDSQVRNATNSASPTQDNFVVTSPTSIGGQKQAKVNFASDPNNRVNEDPGEVVNLNYEHIYLSDQVLDGGAKTFANALHMEGTWTINMPSTGAQDLGTEPNFCFCWYDPTDTRHRIGLGLSNTTEAGFSAQPDKVRFDLFYAATGGNGFVFATKDGTGTNGDNALVPDGTYSFTFDYVPGSDLNSANTAGSSMSATITNGTTTWSRTLSPLPTSPWFHDAFSLSKFGVIIRTTGTTVAGDYNGGGGVDGSDYVLWRQGGPLASEVDNIGTVDAGDYTAWAARFGNSSRNGVYDFGISNLSYTGGTAISGSGLGAGAVPEPTTALLALFAGLAMVPSWRRRCWS